MLPGTPGVFAHQWGTYILPAASKATVLTWPSETNGRTCRSVPSALCHCTLPSSMATKTSPEAMGPFETVTVIRGDAPAVVVSQPTE
ncbi:MAG: hypothetical protein DMF80_22440 [Acidobacteria bacterium]|nr:MAG: hypothetical protein DMF80_22440 [Acidobacteriota bacterium]